MYFILSKLLLLFIFPFTWIVVLFIYGLITKKPKLKRRLLLSGAILMLVFSSPLLYNRFINAWDVPPPPANSRQHYSAVIILGGYASEDSRGQGRFNGAADRFIQGVRLYNTGQVNQVVITGGNASLNPSGFREGSWIKSQLRLFNVPDSAILMENRSRNTIENALYAKALLDSAGLKPPYLLLTSAFHMRRSVYIFNKAGMQVMPYSSNYESGFGMRAEELLPDAYVLVSWNTYMKEIVGLAAAYFKKIPAY
jgi:uncharacterized SAM-binding protein YcdF (DUF218 family)